MSTRQPRPPRSKAEPAKPITPAPEPQPAPTVVAPAPEPQPEPPKVQATAPTEPTAAPAPTKANNKSIGINFPSARTRRHLEKLNINSALEQKIAELKVDTLAFKVATEVSKTKTVSVDNHVETDGKKKLVHESRPATEQELADAAKTIERLSPVIADLEAKVTALTHEKTRFSNEAPVSLSIVCEEMTSVILHHGMDQMLKNKKKIIQVGHLHEAGVDSLPLSALFTSLPSFQKNAEKLEKSSLDAAAKEHDEELVSRVEREFKKKFAVKSKAKKSELADSILAAPLESTVAKTEDSAQGTTEPEEDDSHDAKTSFKHYIQQIFKSLQETKPEYKDLRISNNVKEYLSDLVVELIQRLSGLLVLVASSMKNKTINENTVMRTIEYLMTDGHAPVKSIEYKEGQFPDPEFVKAENAKREEAKKNGTTYQKVTNGSVPMIKGLVAVQIVSYPTSGFDTLNARVQEKLKQYAALSDDAKKALEAAGSQ